MKVSTQAVVEVNLDREKVFEHASVVENMPRFFRGAGPVPGIERAETVGGGAMEKGVVRRFQMSDGSTMDEEIVEYEPPLKFAYRISGLKPPLSLIVGEMGGRWSFTPHPKGTRIAWHYWGELRSPLMYPVGKLLFEVFMKRAMDDCLRRVRDTTSA